MPRRRTSISIPTYIAVLDTDGDDETMTICGSVRDRDDDNACDYVHDVRDDNGEHDFYQKMHLGCSMRISYDFANITWVACAQRLGRARRF